VVVVVPVVTVAIFAKQFLMSIISLNNMSEEKQSRVDFSKCQGPDSRSVLWKHVDCFVHTQGGKEWGTNVLLSPRKHTKVPKRVTYLDEFQKDVSCRIVFNIMTTVKKSNTCS
jgi:hypothetical protein